MDPLKELGMHAGASPGIFRKAEMLRKNMTLPEKKMWNFLKTKPMGYKFRRQHPFGIYILDFYCHMKKLSIEVDGKNHEKKTQIIYDQERTLFIRELKVLELRYRNEEVLTNFDKIEKDILEHLGADTL